MTDLVTIRLGNEYPAHDPEAGSTVTTLRLPAGTPPSEALAIVKGAIPFHFAVLEAGEDELDPTLPSWVESDDDAIAQLLAGEYGIHVGRPDDWEGLDDQEDES